MSGGGIVLVVGGGCSAGTDVVRLREQRLLRTAERTRLPMQSHLASYGFIAIAIKLKKK